MTIVYIQWMKNAKLTNEDATCEKGYRGFKIFRPKLYKLEGQNGAIPQEKLSDFALLSGVKL